MTSLRVVVCRYKDGRVERHEVSVQDTQYIAVSHVWEEAQWLHVTGIDWEVLVSPEKAKFMVESLPSIVGSGYFWMDILCINQRDKAARIAVTQHIPTIFRSAQRTVVIRSGFVIRDCCVHAMGDLGSWVATKSPCRERLLVHVERSHNRRQIEEANLSRLWVLQEIILSDTIQFVRCDHSKTTRETDESESPEHIEELAVKLMSTWASWAKYGSNEKLRDAHHLDFVRAFFECGTLSHLSRAKHRPYLPESWEFTMQIWSTHRTTKARDFILAVMPQYSFYVLPDQARTMTFSQLFADCFAQLESKNTNLWLAPGIPHGHSGSMPEPAYLGDFVKLCLGPRLKNTSQTRAYRVQLQTAKSLSKEEVVQNMHHSACSSQLLWPAARRGEFAALSKEPDSARRFGPANQQQVIAALRVLSEEALSSHEVLSTLKSGASHPVDNNTLLYAAALVSCGIGLSAFEWARQYLAPAFVEFSGKQFVALVPASLLQDDSRYQFYLMEGVKYFGSGILDKKRYVLIAKDKGVQELESYVLCLFPHDVDLFGWKIWKNWI